MMEILMMFGKYWENVLKNIQSNIKKNIHKIILKILQIMKKM